jgi:hypothetical protein
MFSSGVRKLLLLGGLALGFAVTAAISQGTSPGSTPGASSNAGNAASGNSSGNGGSGANGIGNGGPSPTGSSGYDRKFMTSEFKRAQDLEMKGFESKEKSEASNMAVSQKSRRSDFERKERADRRKFFAETHVGAEKRAYVKSMIARREELKKTLSDEKAQYQKDAEERLEALVDDQQRKRASFQAALKNGERPADSLWPQPGIMSEPSPNR